MAKKKRAAEHPAKMSAIMKEMLERLLRVSEEAASSEATHAALFLANAAWNECVGLGAQRERYRDVWETFEAEKPDLWDELKSRDIEAMIDELVEYKKARYPDDRRRILSCGCTPQGTIRVAWLGPAADGVDPKWETHLYGLVLSNMDDDAVRFLKKTRKMSQKAARIEVAKIRLQLDLL